MKVEIEQKEDYRVKINGHPVGEVSLGGYRWWAHTFDKVGNSYRLGHFGSKDIAVDAVVKWHR